MFYDNINTSHLSWGGASDEITPYSSFLTRQCSNGEREGCHYTNYAALLTRPVPKFSRLVGDPEANLDSARILDTENSCSYEGPQELEDPSRTGRRLPRPSLYDLLQKHSGNMILQLRSERPLQCGIELNTTSFFLL